MSSKLTGKVVLRLSVSSVFSFLILWVAISLTRTLFADEWSWMSYARGAVTSVLIAVLIMLPIAVVLWYFRWTKLWHNVVLGVLVGWLGEFALHEVRVVRESMGGPAVLDDMAVDWGSFIGWAEVVASSLVFSAIGLVFFYVAYGRKVTN